VPFLQIDRRGAPAGRAAASVPRNLSATVEVSGLMAAGTAPAPEAGAAGEES
jgi:hypothetical protein